MSLEPLRCDRGGLSFMGVCFSRIKGNVIDPQVPGVDDTRHHVGAWQVDLKGDNFRRIERGLKSPPLLRHFAKCDLELVALGRESKRRAVRVITEAIRRYSADASRRIRIGIGDGDAKRLVRYTGVRASLPIKRKPLILARVVESGTPAKVEANSGSPAREVTSSDMDTDLARGSI